MRPVEFPGANLTLLKPASMTDEECSPLPTHRKGDLSISCWELSEGEMLKLQRTKRIWLWVLSTPSQPPVSLDVDSPFESGPDQPEKQERPPVDPPEPPRQRQFG